MLFQLEIVARKMSIKLGNFELNRKANSFLTERYTIYWQGLIYSNGVNAGLDTIRLFAANLAGGLVEAITQLKGMFFVVVHDRLSRKIFAFVDSSGLFHVF